MRVSVSVDGLLTEFESVVAESLEELQPKVINRTRVTSLTFIVCTFSKRFLKFALYLCGRIAYNFIDRFKIQVKVGRIVIFNIQIYLLFLQHLQYRQKG